MRDAKDFERLLDEVLAGRSVPAWAWEPYRDRAAILITDLSGFTRITRELGAAPVLALLHGMRKIAVPILRANGGIPVKYQADDLFAAFGSPCDALEAAIALEGAFGAPDVYLPAPVRLCMGIGYGEVLWWGDGDLFGEEVNLASKLGEDQAGPEEILLTKAAAEEVLRLRPSIRLSPVRSIRVGGKAYDYFAYDSGA